MNRAFWGDLLDLIFLDPLQNADCLQLKKCASGSVCFEHLCREKRRQTEREMLNEYEKWKKKDDSEGDDFVELC